MKKAFSLFEIMIAIALLGAMAYFSINYINTDTLKKESVKSQLQSHFNLITAAILQCKEYSGSFPIDQNGSIPTDSQIYSLECNTSTPYSLDGGNGFFMPIVLSGFSSYTATQNGDEFYFSTYTNKDSGNDLVLQDLNNTYSPRQYELTYDTTKVYLKFYISR